MAIASGSIIAMGSIGTLAGIYGSVSHGKSFDQPLLGGFVATTILLGIGQTRADRLAVMFAAAFMITSLAVNGTALFGTVTKLVGPTVGGAGGKPEQIR